MEILLLSNIYLELSRYSIRGIHIQSSEIRREGGARSAGCKKTIIQAGNIQKQIRPSQRWSLQNIFKSATLNIECTAHHHYSLTDQTRGKEVVCWVPNPWPHYSYRIWNIKVRPIWVFMLKMSSLALRFKISCCLDVLQFLQFRNITENNTHTLSHDETHRGLCRRTSPEHSR